MKQKQSNDIDNFAAMNSVGVIDTQNSVSELKMASKHDDNILGKTEDTDAQNAEPKQEQPSKNEVFERRDSEAARGTFHSQNDLKISQEEDIIVQDTEDNVHDDLVATMKAKQ